MTGMESIALGNVTLWPRTGELFVGDMCHHLSKEPARILGVLLAASPRVVPHEDIHQSAGCAMAQVSKLRSILRDTGASVTIVTARGIGMYAEEVRT